MLIPIARHRAARRRWRDAGHTTRSAERVRPDHDAGDIGLLVSSVVSGVFSALASIVVTGLIVRVVEQALVGREDHAPVRHGSSARDGCSRCSG